MKKSIIITVVLASLLVAVSNTLAADYVSSAFPSDQILQELAGYCGPGDGTEYTLAGKVKHPTEKGVYKVYAYHISPSEIVEMILRKTDRNYWVYEATENVYSIVYKGILQTSY